MEGFNPWAARHIFIFIFSLSTKGMYRTLPLESFALPGGYLLYLIHFLQYCYIQRQKKKKIDEGLFQVCLCDFVQVKLIKQKLCWLQWIS